MTPSRRRKSTAKRSVDGVWPILACGAVGVFVIAGVVTTLAVGSPWRGMATESEVLIFNDVEARTGSIVVVPFRGDQCQHNLFDNKTGQIWFSGYVSCDVALSQGGAEKGKGWSMARTEAIRGGFRWKP